MRDQIEAIGAMIDSMEKQTIVKKLGTLASAFDLPNVFVDDDEMQDFLVKHNDGQFSVAEVAQRMNISPNDIQQRLRSFQQFLLTQMENVMPPLMDGNEGDEGDGEEEEESEVEAQSDYEEEEEEKVKKKVKKKV